MWQRIRQGQNIRVLVKNLTKSGEYYWVSTDFEIHHDEISGSTEYIAFRRATSQNAINTIEPLYKTLLQLEKKHGQEASLCYLQGYLDERHTTFDAFMDSILKPQGLIALIFNRVKSSFLKAA